MVAPNPPPREHLAMRVHPTTGRVYARFTPTRQPAIWIPLHGTPRPVEVLTDADVRGWAAFATEPATSSRGRRHP